MRYKKGLTLLVAALVVTALLAWLGWPELASMLGFSTLPSGRPDRVQMRIGVNGAPLLTFRDAREVQQLYTAIAALPQTQSGQLCTQNLGIYDTLTFQQGATTLATVVVMEGGCPSIGIAGKPRWQITPGFWRQLNETIARAIAQMAPPASVQRLDIQHSLGGHLPPQTASSLSPQTVQRFYQTLLALPVVSSEGQEALFPVSSGYQLAFHTAHQAFLVTLDQKVGEVSFAEDIPSTLLQPQLDAFTTSPTFERLFAEILSGVTFAPARPDAAFFNASSSDQLTAIPEGPLYQSLYHKILSLAPARPQSLPPPADCAPTSQRSAYEISFIQEGLLVLFVQTGACGVEIFPHGPSLWSDHGFWALMHRVAQEVHE